MIVCPGVFLTTSLFDLKDASSLFDLKDASCLRCCTLFHWPAMVFYGFEPWDSCSGHVHFRNLSVWDRIFGTWQGVGIVSDIFMGAIEKARTLFRARQGL